MSGNDGVRITLHRRDDYWRWTLTAKGSQHVGSQREDTAGPAAEAAETYRRQLDLAENTKKA
jgi:hypothetical protein